MTGKYVLKLYVTGQTPRSQRAIANLRRLCEEELDGAYEMVVIDVLERPQLAEDEKILATPTLNDRAQICRESSTRRFSVVELCDCAC